MVEVLRAEGEEDAMGEDASADVSAPSSDKLADVSAPSSSTFIKKITHVLLDLDGTLLDTEALVLRVCQEIVESFGVKYDNRGLEKRLGKSPLAGAQAAVDDFGLPISGEEYLALSVPKLRALFPFAHELAGANRLIQHLKKAGIPMAIATSSPRKNMILKLSPHEGWLESFSALVAGDDVKEAKPAPDIFLKAAAEMGADPATCLVIEDSPAGVEAAKAAGMAVVAVPSLPRKSARPLYASADQVCSSLLDLRLEDWGLPPFTDWVHRALPIQPMYLGGEVVKGFGRGSKVLGIPTANLPASCITEQVAEATCGIYLGWAGLSNRGVFKMVMSIGWNPYFDNAQKTVEPWLLHDFGEDFYGEELRLVVCGYIRPEADFPSLEALVERIHEDGRVAREALDHAPYAIYGEDQYLRTPLSKQIEVAAT